MNAIELTVGQYELVYNAFSFTIAVMGAATLFSFFGRSQVAPAYRTALTITGLVTFIAWYHYFRIFNSWEAAYTVVGETVKATGVKFNDAYRYVDWLLTVPLLLVELILVMRLPEAESTSRATKLGFLAGLMVILGYPGEIAAESGTRWLWWCASMVPFLIIMFDLFVGLSNSIASQPPAARSLIQTARLVTVVTWSFYPVVYILPMVMGGATSTSLVAVQIGYTIADILAKAGFGVLIYRIAMKKSEAELAH